MPRNIDHYFSLHSPWAYIGHVPFMEVVRRHDVKVTCKPISLASVFAETGGLPVAKRHPARLRYRILELQRWREKRGLRRHPQAGGRRNASLDALEPVVDIYSELIEVSVENP